MSAVKAGIAFDETKFKSYVLEAVEKPFADDENTPFPPATEGNVIDSTLHSPIRF